jgi:hypothetical protein
MGVDAQSPPALAPVPYPPAGAIQEPAPQCRARSRHLPLSLLGRAWRRIRVWHLRANGAPNAQRPGCPLHGATALPARASLRLRARVPAWPDSCYGDLAARRLAGGDAVATQKAAERTRAIGNLGAHSMRLPVVSVAPSRALAGRPCGFHFNDRLLSRFLRLAAVKSHLSCFGRGMSSAVADLRFLCALTGERNTATPGA